MATAKKIVLVSKTGYDALHEDLLRSLIARKIGLFCAVGVDCELWEDVMDELVVGPTGGIRVARDNDIASGRDDSGSRRIRGDVPPR